VVAVEDHVIPEVVEQVVIENLVALPLDVTQ